MGDCAAASESPHAILPRSSSPEVADIFRYCMESSPAILSADKRRVVRAILRCRTSELGYCRRRCDKCGHIEISYASCRNRHCPKCQGSRAAKWTESRVADLLDVPYFHTVFTLPSELRAIAYQNKRVVYELMFRAVSESMQELAKDPKHLGGQVTFFAILHSWTQKQEYHPHIHAASPKGGLSPDGKSWVMSKYDFYLPVFALGKLFRGKILTYIRHAHDRGELKFFGPLSHLSDRWLFEQYLLKLRKDPWVVYSKRPFGGSEQVLKYLSLYTHRVSISNRRILEFKDGQVTFSYRDNRLKKKRRCKISAQEFMRRFLLHILPRGFTKIRHYGFLANRNKAKNLVLARELIKEFNSRELSQNQEVPKRRKKKKVKPITPFIARCSRCQQGVLVMIEHIFKDRTAITLRAPPEGSWVH